MIHLDQARALGLAAAGAIVAAAGCDPQPVSCEELAAQLLPCDLRPRALACDALAPHEQIALLDRLEHDGCAGLRSEHSHEVDGRACRAFDWECPAALGPAPDNAETRYPVVFVGGIDARSTFDWSADLLDAVARHGPEVHHISLPGWAPVPVRSEALWEALERLPTAAPRVNLVCYAVAGLDCRHVVSPGGLFAGDDAAAAAAADRIASVTTIATPHRGTAVANVALALSRYGAADGLLGALLGEDREGAGGADDAQVRQALDGLTNERALAFNQQIVDAAGVHYRSWAGVSHVGGQPQVPSPEEIEQACASPDGAVLMLRHPGTRDTMSELLWATAPFASRTLGEAGQEIASPTDGMVSVRSAQWGEFHGCVPADHYDVIGQFGDLGPDPDTGFDAVRFYLNLCADLAARGL